MSGDDELVYLPYGVGPDASSGWSGSDTSKERAVTEDADGTTSKRQHMALAMVGEARNHGLTWKELADWTGWHHGQASGVLSVLHKVGRLSRLTTRRDRCLIYVLPEYVAGRVTTEQGWKRTPPEVLSLIADIEALDGDLLLRTEVEAVLDKYRGGEE